MYRICFILLCVLNSNMLSAQFKIENYQAVQFAAGESRVPTDRKAFNLSFQYIGNKLIPFLNHKIGLSHSFSLATSSIFHTVGSFNVGGGLSKRWITITGFIGPSVVVDKYRKKLGTKAEQDKSPVGIGVNGSASFIVKPVPEIGLGLEAFRNVSTAGTSWGTLFVIHLSNTK